METLKPCKYCKTIPKILCINKIWQITCMNIDCKSEFTIRNVDKLQCIEIWNGNVNE